MKTAIWFYLAFGVLLLVAWFGAVIHMLTEWFSWRTHLAVAFAGAWFVVVVVVYLKDRREYLRRRAQQ